MTELIAALIGATGLRERDVRLIISTAPARYKTYPINKRSGGKRWISQPARELKILQRAFLSEFLTKLPVHSAASAYRPGKSIRDNAAAHQNNGPILKIDFADFFPSIRARDWEIYCYKHEIFRDPDELKISTNLLFTRDKNSTVLKLAIGAPTSPHLSNLLLYELDDRISTDIAGDKITYTRYADDITFSAPRTGYLQGVERHLKMILKELKSPSLRINNEKTVFATLKYKRMITGLVLSNDKCVTIGHSRKRQLRATMHHAAHGKLDVKELAALAGFLAFINDVEPTMFEKIRARYGEQFIREIKSHSRASS